MKLKDLINKLCLIEKSIGGDAEVWLHHIDSGNESLIKSVYIDQYINGQNKEVNEVVIHN